ncbi:hypothetical protein N7471_013213 [Penicillium samsonianum]|uniref:uncharacterized protein n=1 Tax=Penicillium samsonianum TaxID=1882272 RepID=UPI00254724D4|nr:uncharacterized protein N7471_013213 [Penicillium samsonianum]KAJ6118593.1 hypothetical protein N7471_013213 [Penicillium samsonianum]
MSPEKMDARTWYFILSLIQPPRKGRSNPIGNIIATIEEADLPKFHELCFAATEPLPQQRHLNRLGLRAMMPARWKQEPREWLLLIWDRAFEEGIFKPLDV